MWRGESMGGSGSKILLVDDESHVIAALRRALADEPWQVSGCGSGGEALQLMERERFKAVVSDERMPGMDGATFLTQVKERHPETVRLLLTGHATLEAALRAVNGGEVYRFFTKPWNDAEVVLALRHAVEKYDLEMENRRLLATVRHQSQELKYLERIYPGIGRVARDASGAIRLDPEMAVSDEEIARAVAACNEEG